MWKSGRNVAGFEDLTEMIMKSCGSIGNVGGILSDLMFSQE
jgi:hypothetical protein